MKQVKPIWINEAEASALAGLNPKTFRRYVVENKLPIAYTRITRKAEPLYNKSDIEKLLLERSRNAA